MLHCNSWPLKTIRGLGGIRTHDLQAGYRSTALPSELQSHDGNSAWVIVNDSLIYMPYDDSKL